MSEYCPDRWIVLEFTHGETVIRKLFGGWYGGYTGGDSWKLNSGITAIRIYKDLFEFDGYSGSMYQCNRHNYGMSSYMLGIWTGWKKQSDSQEGVSLRILELDEVVVS